MSSDTPKAYSVEALKAHTYDGKSYDVGDTYDFYPSLDPSGISVDAQLESLQRTGFAVRTDRAAVAKSQAKAAAATVATRAAAPKAAKVPRAARLPNAPRAGKTKR